MKLMILMTFATLAFISRPASAGGNYAPCSWCLASSYLEDKTLDLKCAKDDCSHICHFHSPASFQIEDLGTERGSGLAGGLQFLNSEEPQNCE